MALLIASVAPYPYHSERWCHTDGSFSISHDLRQRLEDLILEPVGLFDLRMATGSAVATEDGDVPPLGQEEVSSLSVRASDRRRRDFALGRLAARRAMQSFGEPPTTIPRGRSGEPIWPSGLVGSITHSNDAAMSVIADRNECLGVGIDLEHRRPVDDIRDLVVFGPERDWLGSHDHANRDDRLLELFTAKESIFKAFFPLVGQYFDFDVVSLEPVPGQSAFEGRFVGEVGGKKPTQVVTVAVAWSGDMVLALTAVPAKQRESMPIGHPKERSAPKRYEPSELG